MLGSSHTRRRENQSLLRSRVYQILRTTRLFYLRGFPTRILYAFINIRLAAGWAVRGSNPGRYEIFPHASRPAQALTQLSSKWVPFLLPGRKAAGPWN